MKSNTGSNSIVLLNVLSTLILSGINFITIPIFTRLLGAEQYGYYSVFNAWLSIASCIMGLKIQSSIGTGIYFFEKDYKSFRKSILYFGIGISFVFCCIILGINWFLPENRRISYYLLVIFLVCAMASYVIEFAQLAFTYEKKAKLNFFISVGLSLSSTLLSLFLINNYKNEKLYLLRVYGTLVPYLLCSIALLLYLSSNKGRANNKEYWKYGLAIGAPIVFHALSQNILSQSDRVMMQNFGCGGIMIGIYSFYYTFTNVLAIILNALNNSWCPFYYDDLNERNYDLLRKKTINYTELFTVLACGFLLLSREFSFWFSGDEYVSGVNIIPLLVISIYLIFMYQFAVNFEFFNKKTKIIAAGTCIAGVINVILNAILIPIWGMYGATLATVVSYLILVVAHYVLASHIKEMKFDLKIRPIVLGLLIVCVVSMLFVILKDYVYIRWTLAITIGLLEIFRIYKRKSIF